MPDSRSHSSRPRRLRIEPLEDRRVLAAVVVTNNLDTVDGDTSSLAALEATPGDDGISLREAILAANNTPGADEITFDFGHDGPEVILLTQGELEITDTLSITGDGAELLTIDAQQQSRVIDFVAESESLSLAGMTLTGGDAGASNRYGGGVSFESMGSLSISGSTIRDNVAEFKGGGIFLRDGALILQDSLVSGNQSESGAAIYGRTSVLELYRSTISENFLDSGYAYSIINLSGSELHMEDCIFRDNEAGIETSGGETLTLVNSSFTGNTGTFAFGQINVGILDCEFVGNDQGPFVIRISVFGTIERTTIANNFGTALVGGSASDLTVIDSAIRDNTRLCRSCGGGGIKLSGSKLLLVNSVIANNENYYAAGISAFRSTITMIDSTIANNVAEVNYGAVWVRGYNTLEVINSTIVGNRASQYAGIGGALGVAIIRNSIIAENQEEVSTAPNLSLSPVENLFSLDVDYSLIGDTTGSGIDETTGIGNLLNVDPKLGPLADHGGPTLTHALLPGSPALDAGDPAIGFDPTEFDQRGEPYYRVADGGSGLRIDIGAYESQGVPGYPVGDYNHDGIANLADYTVWRDTLGSTTDLAADGNENDEIDAGDYTVWKQHFGNTAIPLTPVTSAVEAEAVDAALALYLSPESDAVLLEDAAKVRSMGLPAVGGLDPAGDWWVVERETVDTADAASPSGEEESEAAEFEPLLNAYVWEVL